MTARIKKNPDNFPGIVFFMIGSSSRQLKEDYSDFNVGEGITPQRIVVAGQRMEFKPSEQKYALQDDGEYSIEEIYDGELSIDGTRAWVQLK